MSRWRKYVVGLFTCILIAGSAKPVSVQAVVPIYAPFLAVSYGQAAGATYPSLAYNPQNQEYLLVWCHQLAGSVAIYAQTISIAGVLSSIYPVSETSTDIQRCKPDVAYNTTTHNYLVVWENIISGPQFSVHGRLFTPGGAMGAEVTFDSSGSSNYVYPAVAYSSTSNEFLVVWASQPYGGNYSIWAQRLSSTGVKLGGNYTVFLGSGPENAYDPDVAYNPARNEYLVVWTDQSPSPSGLNRDVIGRRLTYDLVPLGGVLLIGFNTVEDYAPAVAALPTPAPESGRYLVVWEMQYAQNDRDTVGRFVQGDGTIVDLASISGTSLDERAPAVTGNIHDNLFLVSWNSTYLPPYQANIGVRACTVSLQGGLKDIAWVGGIKAGMSAVASGPGDQFLGIFEDTTFFANADLFGRFWGDQLFLPVTVR